MKRRTNPLAVFLLILLVIGAIAVAFTLKGVLPDYLKKWERLIFWAVLVATGGIGAVLIGKFLGRR